MVQPLANSFQFGRVFPDVGKGVPARHVALQEKLASEERLWQRSGIDHPVRPKTEPSCGIRLVTRTASSPETPR